MPRTYVLVHPTYHLKSDRFPLKFCRDHPLGEVSYIWADPASPNQQVALSSIAQAMEEKKVMAIARWVGRDGADPKMGVLSPSIFENVDCLLWVQVCVQGTLVLTTR